MGDLSRIDSRYRASEAKTRRKVGGDCSVSRQDSRALEKLTTDRQMAWGLRAERAAVGDPLAMDGRAFFM